MLRWILQSSKCFNFAHGIQKISPTDSTIDNRKTKLENVVIENVNTLKFLFSKENTFQYFIPIWIFFTEELEAQNTVGK